MAKDKWTMMKKEIRLWINRDKIGNKIIEMTIKNFIEILKMTKATKWDQVVMKNKYPQ